MSYNVLLLEFLSNGALIVVLLYSYSTVDTYEKLQSSSLPLQENFKRFQDVICSNDCYKTHHFKLQGFYNSFKNPA